MSVATAPPAVPQVVPSCTFNGVPANGALDVTPGVTSVAISCTGLPANSQVFVADASPLAGALTAPNITDQLNLTMGFALAVTDAAGNLNTNFLIPATTVSNNTDGTCPPTQAQVNTGLTNCALAVASLTGTPFGFVLLNYPGQPSPPTPNLTLNPTTGAVGTTVTVSGSGWWGSGTTDNPPAITVGGVAATTSTANVPHAAYTIGGGAFGSGGTLTGGTITGTFDIPVGAPEGADTVVATQTNNHPANNAPYTGVPISASSTFTVPSTNAAPVTSNATATIDRNVSNTTMVTLPATDTDATPVASCSLVGSPSDPRLSVTIGSPTSSGCPATLTDNGSATVGATVTFQFTATDTANLTGNTSTVTVTIIPTAVVDGALDVIVSGPVRTAAGDKTIVGKATNVGTSPITVCDTDISWAISVNGSPTTGTVAPKNPGCSTLGPGSSHRFRYTWTFGTGEVSPGATVDFTGTLSVANDVDLTNNISTETRTAK
jgi:hypothetical protein